MNTASYHNNQAIWTELLPGGHHWSGRIQKGTILKFTSLGAQANVSIAQWMLWLSTNKSI
ncbi:hypothetical protein NRA27_20755 [Acinetobacter baumannii]|nr:hypothetical protein [Acinetobacter baumannii]